jgi:hypothetical protein
MAKIGAGACQTCPVSNAATQTGTNAQECHSEPPGAILIRLLGPLHFPLIPTIPLIAQSIMFNAGNEPQIADMFITDIC